MSSGSDDAPLRSAHAGRFLKRSPKKGLGASCATQVARRLRPDPSPRKWPATTRIAGLIVARTGDSGATTTQPRFSFFFFFFSFFSLVVSFVLFGFSFFFSLPLDISSMPPFERWERLIARVGLWPQCTPQRERRHRKSARSKTGPEEAPHRRRRILGSATRSARGARPSAVTDRRVSAASAPPVRSEWTLPGPGSARAPS